jgi:hypothetical protein
LKKNEGLMRLSQEVQGCSVLCEGYVGGRDEMGGTRIMTAIAGVAAIGLVSLAAAPANAGGSFSFSFGWPAYTYYAPYPVYYPPTYYVAPAYPLVYAQPYSYPPSYSYQAPYQGQGDQGQTQPPPPSQYSQQPPADQYSQQQTWYYCQDPAGYYPDVENCNTQWQQVPVNPTSPPVAPSE